MVHRCTGGMVALGLLLLSNTLGGCSFLIDLEQSLAEITAVDMEFGGRIDLENLPNYASQSVPPYITKDNLTGNAVTDIGATLGRVLFYDVKLSVDQTVSCASCHQQALAFSDPDALSNGVAGKTGRHSMRLVNARFAEETRFFWDERASTLEDQTTQPIQDHIEMGYSGTDGAPDLSELIDLLSEQAYYNELFMQVYGDAVITEERMQRALAQFVRSIQSFDSKYDTGRSQVNNNGQPFPNFTDQENMGKRLFMQAPQFDGQGPERVGGGLGCGGCHRPPEFDIDPQSRNNGVTTDADGNIDLTITRSPSLRDMFNQDGLLNGPLMHTGDFATIDELLDHYNTIDRAGNNQLDRRLGRGGGQQLNMTDEEREAVIAFLKTLSGVDIYQNEKWSNPFGE